MAFPFPTNPGDDLRRLFQIDRLERNARNLEYASIRAGKPGVRVQNADGSTAAVLGETGSGPGIGMHHKGQVRGLGEIFADSDDVAALDGRVGTAEGRLDSHASRLGSAEGRLDSHASRLGSAEGRLDSHASRIGAVEGVNTTQNSRLGTIEANYAAALGGFASLAARLNSHAQRIGANEGNIQSLAADLVSALSDIDSQLGTIATKVNQQDAWLRANTGYPTGGLIPGGN